MELPTYNSSENEKNNVKKCRSGLYLPQLPSSSAAGVKLHFH
jgi:hypothetical protein